MLKLTKMLKLLFGFNEFVKDFLVLIRNTKYFPLISSKNADSDRCFAIISGGNKINLSLFCSLFFRFPPEK